MEETFFELNSIFMMANSGARGSFKQIRQLAAELPKPLAGGKPGKTVVGEKGAVVTMALLREVAEAFEGQDEAAVIPVRSVLKCKAESGVCRACYGIFLATGGMCEIGDA